MWRRTQDIAERRLFRQPETASQSLEIMQYLIKIFSGPHVGAEVLLVAGETIIGSDSECDIVLDDRLIAPRHVAVTISDNEIECKSLCDAPLLIDGKPCFETTVRPFQYFTIGTTHLAIGPADKPWPQFDLSDFQLRSPTEDPSAQEAAEGENGANSSGDTFQEEGSLAANQDTPQVKGRFAIGGGAAMMLAVLLLNVLAISAGVSFNWFGSESPTELLEELSVFTKLQQLTQSAAPHVVVEEKQSCVLMTGYVSTDNKRDQLRRLAQEITPSVSYQVQSTDSLRRAVQQQIEADGWSELDVTSVGPGRIRIRGNLPDTPAEHRRWQATKQRIEEEIPTKQLSFEIKKSKAATDIAATESNPHVPDSAAKFGETAPLVVSAVLPILDVRIANDKVITFVDGRQISIGGRFPDGSRVEKIDLNRAMVRTKSGQQLLVPFGTGG